MLRAPVAVTVATARKAGVSHKRLTARRVESKRQAVLADLIYSSGCAGACWSVNAHLTHLLLLHYMCLHFVQQLHIASIVGEDMLFALDIV